MKFAAFGRTKWLLDGITAAVASGHEPVLIGTCEAMPEYSVHEGDFEKMAKSLGCPFFCDAAINKDVYISMARNSKAEVAISVNWLTMIGQEMIDQFRFGIINAHAGDLPRYRGNACPNWAILSGEPEVVFTLHQMSQELDAGPILLKRALAMTPDIYIGDVYRAMDDQLPCMFAEVMDGLAQGMIKPVEQDKRKELSLRCFPRMPQDGCICWSESAEYLGRLVRASAEPFSGAFTFLNSEKLIVWRAYADSFPSPCKGIPGQVIEVRRSTGEVVVLANDGVLILQEVEVAGMKRSKASTVIKSTKIRLGINLVEEVCRLQEKVRQLEYRNQAGNAEK